MGGLKGHRVQIEGNNIFEIRKYVRPCFTSVNRPQASHLLPHITHSIEIYIYGYIISVVYYIKINILYYILLL